MTKKSSLFYLIFTLCLLVGIYLIVTHPPQISHFLSPAPTPSVLSATSSSEVIQPVLPSTIIPKTSPCLSLNGLPDKACTPGAIDPQVTQNNLRETICRKGYTQTVRPPVSYTNKLKLQQIKAYDYTDPNPQLYEEDHLIPLELGGAPSDPQNLWPEPGHSPNPKDATENRCNHLVCQGLLLLTDAQRQIATDWRTACPL